MKVITAETAGFCYGVSRAVSMAYKAIEEEGGIYTYGPLVHNPLVTGDLASRGTGIIESYEELERLCAAGALQGKTVLIRAHGVGRRVTELLERWGIRVIDATCPHVRKIHEIVREKRAEGYRILIVGDPSHPEVTGILGQIGNDAEVLETVEMAEGARLDQNARYCVVSQTTMSVEKFKKIVDILKKKKYYVFVVNTICNATQMRQKETSELAARCDAMIVIGGKDSSNTRKLYDISRSICKATYYVQSVGELAGMLDSTVRCVGITAGASTPKSIIEEVQLYVRDEL